jgi:hypothetical protein
VFYYPEVSEALCNAVQLYLKRTGVFYGISPSFRTQGNTAFIQGSLSSEKKLTLTPESDTEICFDCHHFYIVCLLKEWRNLAIQLLQNYQIVMILC